MYLTSNAKKIHINVKNNLLVNTTPAVIALNGREANDDELFIMAYAYFKISRATLRMLLTSNISRP